MKRSIESGQPNQQRALHLLEQIAEVLQIPVGQLWQRGESDAPGSPDDRVELLKAYDSLKDADSRSLLLYFARQLVGHRS